MGDNCFLKLGFAPLPFTSFTIRLWRLFANLGKMSYFNSLSGIKKKIND